MDTFDIQDLGKVYPKEALVDCTPPAIAWILANAVKLGDHNVSSLATCSSEFPLKEAGESDPVGEPQSVNQGINEMLWAIHSFGVATNALQEEAIAKILEHRQKSKSSKTDAEKGTARQRDPEQDSSSDQHLREVANATQGENGMHSPEQKADAHRRSMVEMNQWFPNYSDCKQPTAADIQNLMDKSGINENPNLKDDRDHVTNWFANKLLTDNWPLVDGVLRQAGVLNTPKW